MGAWGTGPFGNDDAADMPGALRRMTAPERAQQIRAVLTLAHGYLQVSAANAAVAAAALAAAARGWPADASREAAELVRTGTIPADDQLRERARVALSRVAGNDSEWRELWDDAGQLAKAARILDSIQAYL